MFLETNSSNILALMGGSWKLRTKRGKQTSGVLKYGTAAEAKRVLEDAMHTSKGRCHQVGEHQVYLEPCWLTSNVSIHTNNASLFFFQCSLACLLSFLRS